MLRETFNLTIEVIAHSGVDCLLIGGLAMNHYGFVRATSDVDFMMVGDDFPVIRRAMVDAGFQNVLVRENVVFFRRPEIDVRVDFLKIDRATMQKLWGRSKVVEMEHYLVRVPAPLDLIAMKLFALKQNWARRMVKDLPDILFLIRSMSFDLEKDIKPLALQFADEAIFSRIVEATAGPDGNW